MLSLSQAYDVLLNQSPTDLTEEVGIFQANGRILAENVVCRRDVPAFSNSAMDGYAISHIAPSYTITQSIFAGDHHPTTLQEGECFKIMTGAMIPSNAIAVIPFENAEKLDNVIKPLYPIKEGQNIKFQAEECKIGDQLLSIGTKLDYRSLALLASQGIAKIKVFAPLKIAIFASGNELKEPHQEAKPHQVYNVNAIAYHSILQDFGFSSQYQGILPDCKNTLKETLKQCQDYDVIFTSGGASVGEADFFEEVLRECGATILFHGINLKPGRPTLFAKLGKTLIFSLPGNPLSGIVNLITLAIPTLMRLSGANSFLPQSLLALCKTSFNLKDKRANMVLGNFDGENFEIYHQGKYGSGAILPILHSNAIAIFDEQTSQVKAGEKIWILPIKPTDSKSQFVNACLGK